LPTSRSPIQTAFIGAYYDSDGERFDSSGAAGPLSAGDLQFAYEWKRGGWVSLPIGFQLGVVRKIAGQAFRLRQAGRSIWRRAD
jgi:hypothetical protein